MKCVAFSRNSSRVVSGGEDGRVFVWDTDTRACVTEYRGHPTSVLSVAFSPEGNHVVSADEHGTIRFWDTATRKDIQIMHNQPLLQD